MRIHFIGIGGIGISALAQYYLKTDHKVSGSDLASSETTDLLKKMGAKVFIGAHQISNLKNQSFDKLRIDPERSRTDQISKRQIKNQKLPDLVIYSPAVTKDNPELKEAYKIQDARYKIQVLSYPEALGELTKQFFTIAVSGSHGKSTTTALISVILMRAGLDPTVIIGTKLRELGNNNFRFGGFPKSEILNLKSKILVIESDEYKSSFLHYWPKIIVLTNLEYEHPDYFKNFRHYLRVFKKYLNHLKPAKSLQRTGLCKFKNGIIVANKDDKNVTNMTMVRQAHHKNVILYYSSKQPEAKKIREILKIPGEHNVSNALAALTVARKLKIPDKTTFKALSEYKGAWRRFEIIEAKLREYQSEKTQNITIISDYGHHPTQVKATIQAARERYPKQKIWIIYQPHQYLRTYYLFNDYVRAFDEADEVVLTEIYAVSGREDKKIMAKLSSKQLVEAVKKRVKAKKMQKKGHFVENYQDVPEFLKSRVKNGDVVIVMGAGDIYKIISNF